MICGKCGTEAELKKFTSFEYWYCPKCKDEASAYQAQDVAVEDDTIRRYGVTYGTGFPAGNGTLETWSASGIRAFVKKATMRKAYNTVDMVTYSLGDEWLDVSATIDNELDLDDYFCKGVPTHATLP